MTDVIKFPIKSMPRIVSSVSQEAIVPNLEGRLFLFEQVCEGQELLSDATADMMDFLGCVRKRLPLASDDPCLSGETLERVLKAVLTITSLSASNRDADLIRAVRQWLEINGGANADL